jgi:hypothetical protein
MSKKKCKRLDFRDSAWGFPAPSGPKANQTGRPGVRARQKRRGKRQRLFAVPDRSETRYIFSSWVPWRLQTARFTASRRCRSTCLQPGSPAWHNTGAKMKVTFWLFDEDEHDRRIYPDDYDFLCGPEKKSFAASDPVEPAFLIHLKAEDKWLWLHQERDPEGDWVRPWPRPDGSEMFAITEWEEYDDGAAALWLEVRGHNLPDFLREKLRFRLPAERYSNPTFVAWDELSAWKGRLSPGDYKMWGPAIQHGRDDEGCLSTYLLRLKQSSKWLCFSREIDPEDIIRGQLLGNTIYSVSFKEVSDDAAADWLIDNGFELPPDVHEKARKPTKEKKLTLLDKRILKALLTHGPLKGQTLAEKIDFTFDAVRHRVAFKELGKNGLDLVRNGESGYELTEKGEAVARSLSP